MHLRPHHLIALAAGAAFGLVPQLLAVSPAELGARIARDERMLIVDVRPALAYQQGHIPGAINIPIALLPEKTLPSSARVIVYGDGLGLVGDSEALEIARKLPVASVDVVDGGYAAWLASASATTAGGGVSLERLPGITYQQLVVAPREDIVLLDLRTAVVPAKASSATVAAGRIPDVLDGFAQKLGVQVMRPASTARALSTGTGADPVRAAAVIATDLAETQKAISGTPKLLVLVADSDAAASEAARQLRASGVYRFTILIGGTDIIAHEGRQGSERSSTASPVVSGQN